MVFQSTPPRGGATRFYKTREEAQQFQSTPPRGGATPDCYTVGRFADISIHAPARGGDGALLGISSASYKFQSTPPRGGATSLSVTNSPFTKFQSTPPRGGATSGSACATAIGTDFNPRPREGGRRLHLLHLVRLDGISIHAPARGGDGNGTVKLAELRISIHAPARGGDKETMTHGYYSCYFNPRPREGGRPHSVSQSSRFSPFQSTPPRGGATGKRSRLWHGQLDFNPRPREGGRPPSPAHTAVWHPFQSTPPRGGATSDLPLRLRRLEISIHAPARGGDTTDTADTDEAVEFQSTPPRGGATSSERLLWPTTSHFNPRPREGGRPPMIAGVRSP